MEYINLDELHDIIKKDALENYLRNKSLDKQIMIIKLSELSINKRGENKNKKELERIINGLRKKFPEKNQKLMIY